jgi:hypothetical protein
VAALTLSREITDVMTPGEMDALKVAHYALVTLNGLRAYDPPGGPADAFTIDVSAALARLAALLPPPPYEVPGCGQDGEKA